MFPASRCCSVDIPLPNRIPALSNVPAHHGVWKQIPPEVATPEATPVNLELDGPLVSEALGSPAASIRGRAVEFRVESHSVHRHRSEKRDSSVLNWLCLIVCPPQVKNHLTW